MDVKPGNIFVCRGEGEPRARDLGYEGYDSYDAYDGYEDDDAPPHHVYKIGMFSLIYS
jgi:hypothetical protein